MRLILLMLLMASGMYAQQLNDYQYVIVPAKFEFQKQPNQYRLNTLAKMHLENLGFKVFYDNEELPKEVAINNCQRLTADVTQDNNMFQTKLVVHFKDCMNREVYKTEEGTSREKDLQAGYVEALRNAFASMEKLNYKYSGNQVNPSDLPLAAAAQTSKPTSSLVLDARPIDNGFDLFLKDASGSMYLFTVYRTSDPDVYIAFQKSKQGVLLRKSGQWYFESYESGKLMSEAVTINGMSQ